MYKANRSKGNGWKYAIAGVLTAGAIVGAGYGLDYVSGFSEGQMKKAIAREPGYRSLTNGSMVMRPIETEREAKNLDMLVAGCADRMGTSKSKVSKMMNDANLEMFGEPLDLGNLRVGDKIPFPPECE